MPGFAVAETVPCAPMAENKTQKETPREPVKPEAPAWRAPGSFGPSVAGLRGPCMALESGEATLGRGAGATYAGRTSSPMLCAVLLRRILIGFPSVVGGAGSPRNVLPYYHPPYHQSRPPSPRHGSQSTGHHPRAGSLPPVSAGIREVSGEGVGVRSIRRTGRLSLSICRDVRRVSTPASL